MYSTQQMARESQNSTSQGEFIFKKENTQALILATLIAFIGFFTLSILFLDQDFNTTFKDYFDAYSNSQLMIFGCLFIFGLGILDEYFWRNFLIKTLPPGWIYFTFVGLHYGLMIMLLLNYAIEWQFCFLCAIISQGWHIAMVYARRLFKFSSVMILGIAARLGIFSSFYILFLNTNTITRA